MGPSTFQGQVSFGKGRLRGVRLGAASRCQTWFFVFVRPVPLEFDDDDGSLAVSRCWCTRLSVGFRQSAKQETKSDTAKPRHREAPFCITSSGSPADLRKAKGKAGTREMATGAGVLMSPGIATEPMKTRTPRRSQPTWITSLWTWG